MKLNCHAPLCNRSIEISLIEYIFAYYFFDRKWACPEHMERLNPTSPEYDDHDPNTNPDLNDLRR